MCLPVYIDFWHNLTYERNITELFDHQHDRIV